MTKTGFMGTDTITLSQVAAKRLAENQCTGNLKNGDKDDESSEREQETIQMVPRLIRLRKLRRGFEPRGSLEGPIDGENCQEIPHAIPGRNRNF